MRKALTCLLGWLVMPLLYAFILVGGAVIAVMAGLLAAVAGIAYCAYVAFHWQQHLDHLSGCVVGHKCNGNSLHRFFDHWEYRLVSQGHKICDFAVLEIRIVVEIASGVFMNSWKECVDMHRGWQRELAEL